MDSTMSDEEVNELCEELRNVSIDKPTKDALLPSPVNLATLIQHDIVAIGDEIIFRSVINGEKKTYKGTIIKESDSFLFCIRMATPKLRVILQEVISERYEQIAPKTNSNITATYF